MRFVRCLVFSVVFLGLLIRMIGMRLVVCVVCGFLEIGMIIIL